MPPLSETLVTASEPASSAAEIYRSLRTAIRQKRVKQSDDGVVLMVASPGEQEGKTTIVANLAVTYAQDGKTVVVVDCNLRSSSVHTLFGLPGQTGLVQCLKSASAAKDAICRTSVPNLHVLPAGGQPPNPSELLGSRSMEELLDELKRQYDVVLLDSPSALSFTDAGLLAEYSDGVMLVAKHGTTKREHAKQARLRLEQSGAKMLGIVMNG